jgi:hypothetical protein
MTTTTDLPTTPAEALRWAADRIDWPLPLALAGDPPPSGTDARAAWRLRRWADELAAAPTTWELPAEPGPEVVAVDDGHGCRWERDVPGHWRLVRQAPGAWHPAGWCVKPWRSLLSDHSPLSAAPPEPEV